MLLAISAEKKLAPNLLKILHNIYYNGPRKKTRHSYEIQIYNKIVIKSSGITPSKLLAP